jgi:uncharacterized spore protein YtfJ
VLWMFRSKHPKAPGGGAPAKVVPNPDAFLVLKGEKVALQSGDTQQKFSCNRQSKRATACQTALLML